MDNFEQQLNNEQAFDTDKFNGKNLSVQLT